MPFCLPIADATPIGVASVPLIPVERGRKRLLGYIYRSSDDPGRLFKEFLRAAKEQGFSLEYVEMIYSKVLLSNYKNLRSLLQEFTEPPPNQDKADLQ